MVEKGCKIPVANIRLDDEMLCLEDGDQAKMSALIWKVLTTATRYAKEIKDGQTGEDEINSLLADVRIVYMANPKESTKTNTTTLLVQQVPRM